MTIGTIARQETNKLLEMVDEGLIDPKEVVTMCVKYMSEDDVADMMDCNELSDRFQEEL
jgi:threonine dehydrogenase-like Zn-dependent dehydrogenase